MNGHVCRLHPLPDTSVALVLEPNRRPDPPSTSGKGALRFDTATFRLHDATKRPGIRMQFITENSVLERNLLRCVRQYDDVAFATAWASADTKVFRELVSGKVRIRMGVIGTHFYQTHPDVLDQFVKSATVRFALQPSGVFHPKVFLFWNSAGWEAFIGSANLTKGALTSNSEAVMLVSSADAAAPDPKGAILEAVTEYWGKATKVTKESAARYREMWKLRQPILQRLSGDYGSKPPSKPPVESAVLSMSWREFCSAARQDKAHGFEERCSFLEHIQAIFKSGRSFQEMDLGERRLIAGLPGASDSRWPWFGSMKGVGKFQTAIKANDVHLSRALDFIPSAGLVPRSRYDAYVREFVRAFPEGRDGVATASRLLAMKRPDEFVCLDSMNKKRLCADFGIKVSGMDYDRYWGEVVERIRESPWWNSSPPCSGIELSAWNGRAAMLDAIFYFHE